MKKLLLITSLIVGSIVWPPVHCAVNECTSVDSFNNTIRNTQKPILVDFHAEQRCPPCRTMKPIIEQLSQEMTDICFIKVNADTQSNLANQYNVRSLPTFVLFENGKEKARISGSRSKDSMKSWINSNK